MPVQYPESPIPAAEPASQLVARRRRRRRRRQDRPAISARLLLDDQIKGDVGTLSDDLIADLFPGQTFERDTVRYVAITPWMPASTISTKTSPWTILAVSKQPKPDANRPHSSLQFPASSATLQSFLGSLQNVSTGRAPPRRDTPIEIRILDVIPVGLDTVYVQLDTQALRQLEEVHTKFGGGFQHGSGQKALIAKQNGQLQGKQQQVQKSNKVLEADWRKAARDALEVPHLIHEGDMLPLPLPGHPITHLPPPPAKIVSCEPVSQGIILPSTRVVIVYSHKTPKQKPHITRSMTSISNGIPEEDEDTSNEQFYSAAEDRPDHMSAMDDTSDPDALDSSLSHDENDDDLSDDSEIAFDLSSTLLPAPTTGAMSAFTSATPRASNYFGGGIHTPGSTYSSFTATTAKSAGGKDRLFKVQGLMQKLPDELLHPKPGSDDDEEARVYVETATLVKLGCFSGDWVRIESASDYMSNGLMPFTLGSFGEDQEDPTPWRVVKVYGLPESLSKRMARMPTHKSMTQKPSFLDIMRPKTTPTAYVSPILLANMDSPPHIRLSPLTNISKRITSASFPPAAKEITLLKIATPLSTDRSLQPSLFSALKDHLEQKRRIIKAGDLIAISVDERLGKTVFHGPAGDDAADGDILTKAKVQERRNGDVGAIGVAWFKIGHVVPGRYEDEEEAEFWGGMAFADASNTKIVQTGSEQTKVPSTKGSSWQYYTGVRRLPVRPGQGSGAETATMDVPEPFVSPLRRRLRELISASTSPQAIHLGLPPLAILLTSTQRQIGKAYTAEQACHDLGLHTFVIDSFDILTEGGSGGGDVKTEAFLKARADRALTCGAQYTALLLKHIEGLSADRILGALKEILADSRVLIATTTDIDKVPDGIRGLFTHELNMSAPDEKEREGILQSLVEDNGVRLAPDAELSTVALKTAALVAGDLSDVVDRAVVARSGRLEALVEVTAKVTPDAEDISIRDIEVSGGDAAYSLTRRDLEVAVDAARKNFADSIGAPKIPNVTWNDVGGMTHVKDAVMETIQLPLSRPELFAKGMKKRSGILFYGPPGTGKTLLAKAIATEFSLNFFSVKGPELLNMYIGESEANVRRVFQRARDARPCVVFFDELDSVAPKRGNQGDSGGVMDRIVSQLLAELDGMSDGDEGGGGVFVVGATNRPDLLDQALLRPGRFDKMLYLGISDTHEKQATILEALSRKFTLHPNLSLRRVADKLPFTYTGADLYALCSDAMLKAITRAARQVDAKVAAHNRQLAPGALPITVAQFFNHHASKEDIDVLVEEADFEAARVELVPSVSAEEFGHYERVRRTFEGVGDKPATSNALKSRSMLPPSAPAPLAIRPGPPATNGTNNSTYNNGPNGVNQQRQPPTRTSTNVSQAPSTGSTKSRTLSKLLRKAGGKGKNTSSTFYFDKAPYEESNSNQASVASTRSPSEHTTQHQHHQQHHQHESDEDEYIIRTDAPSSHNGNGVERKVSASSGMSDAPVQPIRTVRHKTGSVGNGLNSGAGTTFGFGSAVEGDDDMYGDGGGRK